MLNFLPRRRGIVTGFMFLSVAVLTVHPTWATSIGADVWNVPTYEETIRTNAKANARMTEENYDTLRRIAIKDSIIEDLVAGRLTLAEATEQFIEINASRPECLARIRADYPGKTDREKMARNVMGFVLVRTHPDERPAVLRQLERDLQRMLSESAGE